MSQGRSLTQIVEEKLASGDVELPVFDRTALKIRQMIERGEYDPQAVEKLVATDPALSGSLLRHANSSFFGGIEKVVTVRDAIVRLGVRQVAELVILSSQRRHYTMRTRALSSLSQQLWRHAVGCGIGAQWLARKVRLENRVQEAFLAGLLHDIGKLLLLRVLDELIGNDLLEFHPSDELVLELLECLHCDQGHALMQTWNLPETYAGIVLHHHDEEYEATDALMSVVRLVDMACNRLGIGIRGKLDVNLAASAEAQRLRASEVVLAELEIRLEDALQLSQ